MNNGSNFPNTLRKLWRKISMSMGICNNGYFFMVTERETQMGRSFFLSFNSTLFSSFPVLFFEQAVVCDWQVLFAPCRVGRIKESNLRFYDPKTSPLEKSGSNRPYYIYIYIKDQINHTNVIPPIIQFLLYGKTKWTRKRHRCARLTA